MRSGLTQLQLLSFIFNSGGWGRILCEDLGPEVLVLFSTPREEPWLFVPLSRAVFHLAAAELFLICEWTPELPLPSNLFRIRNQVLFPSVSP